MPVTILKCPSNVFVTFDVYTFSRARTLCSRRAAALRRAQQLQNHNNSTTIAQLSLESRGNDERKQASTPLFRAATYRCENSRRLVKRVVCARVVCALCVTHCSCTIFRVRKLMSIPSHSLQHSFSFLNRIADFKTSHRITKHYQPITKIPLTLSLSRPSSQSFSTRCSPPAHSFYSYTAPTPTPTPKPTQTPTLTTPHQRCLQSSLSRTKKVGGSRSGTSSCE